MAAKNDIEVANKDVFLKIEPYDSIDIKKSLLEMTASSINMQIISERFKETSRQEIKERAAAKRQLKDASNMIFELIERLPRSREMPAQIKRHIFEEAGESKPKITLKKEDTYSKQLEEIKRKIAELG